MQSTGALVKGSEKMPIRYTVHSLKSVVFAENIIQGWVDLAPYSGEKSSAFGHAESTMFSSEALGK